MDVLTRYMEYINEGLDATKALCKTYKEILSLSGEDEYYTSISEFMNCGKDIIINSPTEVIKECSSEMNDFINCFAKGAMP